ncbi:MAG: hypothetical protein U0793_25280 [Gemmataceae bacterium]
MSAGPEKDLKAIERQLAGLVPQSANIERDRLFYAMGRASLRRFIRLGVAAFVLVSGACLLLGWLLLTIPAPQPQTRTITVYLPTTAAAESASEAERPAAALLVGAPRPDKPDEPAYPSYGSIQKNISRLGEYALPPLTPTAPGADPTPGPTRAGSRPGFLDEFFRSSPGR